jgi:hypothetical protein
VESLDEKKLVVMKRVDELNVDQIPSILIKAARNKGITKALLTERTRAHEKSITEGKSMQSMREEKRPPRVLLDANILMSGLVFEKKATSFR